VSLRTVIRQALDPVVLWKAIYHTEPDDWQQRVLRSDHQRIILNTSRQVGKSTVVSCKALHTALYTPGSLVLLVSRSLRQSSELGKKLFDGYRELGRPVPADSESKLVLELTNKSRVICLPGADPSSIRGFSSVDCLLLDESARCHEELWIACKPMVSVSGGSIILLSTPFGRRGFFYQTWAESEDWLKIQVTAEQCPRLSPAFLRQERRELGERWFNQEYMCAFVEAVGQLFSDDAIDAAFRDIAPLFPIAEALEDDAVLVDRPPLFSGDYR
jgi:hypothetical protein